MFGICVVVLLNLIVKTFYSAVEIEWIGNCQYVVVLLFNKFQ